MSIKSIHDTLPVEHPVATAIGQWYDQHQRDLPWRHTHDPYLIWLSEIILQQTRVVQGHDYYLRFVKAFPRVADLAAATEDEVLKLWQGLGYYSRARNLHAAARQVMEWPDRPTDDPAWFPHRYADVIRLKGVGPYTAAAIASLSADERVAVVDGNVYRVLSRLMDLGTPIDSTQGAKEFQALADSLLPPAHCGRHNQAMMELGAMVCTPTSPTCQECPLADRCMALANGTIELRPVKQGKVKVRQRHLSYYIFKYEKSLYVHQRKAGDIWQGLWEFYLIEEGEVDGSDKKGIGQERENENLHRMTAIDQLLSSPAVGSVTPLLSRKHLLTHQTLLADFILVELNAGISLGADFRCVTWDEWQNLAVPKLISDANLALSVHF